MTECLLVRPDDFEPALAFLTAEHPSMRYMIVEHLRNGDPVPVYARFRASGRLAPDGLVYVDSWVTDDVRRCYQIMECDDLQLLQRWIRAWDDRVQPWGSMDGAVLPEVDNTQGLDNLGNASTLFARAMPR